VKTSSALRSSSRKLPPEILVLGIAVIVSIVASFRFAEKAARECHPASILIGLQIQ
jgi:hypothetical protein